MIVAAVEVGVGASQSYVQESDRMVLLHVGDDWLALDPEELRRAFDRGRKLMGPAGSNATSRSEFIGASSRVVDAEGMQAITDVPSTWFLDMARQRRIPYLKFGKYVRFDITSVLSHHEVQERTQR